MSAPLFDHKKLDACQIELSFISWLTDLFEDLREKTTSCLSEVLDLLDRVSLSQLLNTAEGNGKRIEQGKAMLACIVSMLIKLVDRFDDTPGISRADVPRTSSSRKTRWKGGDHA